MSASQNVVALSPSKQRRPSALDPAFRVSFPSCLEVER